MSAQPSFSREDVYWMLRTVARLGGDQRPEYSKAEAAAPLLLRGEMERAPLDKISAAIDQLYALGFLDRIERVNCETKYRLRQDAILYAFGTRPEETVPRASSKAMPIQSATSAQAGGGRMSDKRTYTIEPDGRGGAWFSEFHGAIQMTHRYFACIAEAEAHKAREIARRESA